MKWKTKASNFYLHLKSLFCGQWCFTFHSIFFFCLFYGAVYLLDRHEAFLAVSTAYKYSCLFRVACIDAVLKDRECIAYLPFSFFFFYSRRWDWQHYSSHMPFTAFNACSFSGNKKYCQRAASLHSNNMHDCSGLHVLVFWFLLPAFLTTALIFYDLLHLNCGNLHGDRCGIVAH